MSSQSRHRQVHGFSGLWCPKCARTAGWMTLVTNLTILAYLILVITNQI